MSTGAPMASYAVAPIPPAKWDRPEAVNEAVAVDVPPSAEGTAERAWRQLVHMLGTAKQLEQPAPIVGSPFRVGNLSRPEGPHWRVVAPGIIVTEDEYARRFAGIDLDEYRRRVSPELFRAFIRYIGVIPGRSNLNVVELADSTDQ